MTTSTINSNGHVSRKTLSTQIDRLDSMLDGLADNLNDAVATAVKDAVALVVREAVEAAVKEVLSNPNLLRAALAQHAPVATQVQPPAAQKPQNRSFKEMIKGGWNWLCKKATKTTTQVKTMLSKSLTWCRENFLKGCAVVRRGCGQVGIGCKTMAMKLGTVGLALWYFRRTCSIVLTAGLAGGVIGYFAGPVISSMLCSLGGMALSVSGMILLPLWRLVRTGDV